VGGVPPPRFKNFKAGSIEGRLFYGKDGFIVTHFAAMELGMFNGCRAAARVERLVLKAL
jgi:hypothetical protein